MAALEKPHRQDAVEQRQVRIVGRGCQTQTQMPRQGFGHIPVADQPQAGQNPVQSLAAFRLGPLRPFERGGVEFPLRQQQRPDTGVVQLPCLGSPRLG